MRSGRLLLLAILPIALVACGGQAVQAEDLPPALRQSDRLLGQAVAALNRNPATPASVLAMPADVQAAWRSTGFFDARVRLYAQKKAAEQRAFDAKMKPLFATAHASAAQARQQLSHVVAGGDVSQQFLSAYTTYAESIDDWITAETTAANAFTDLAAAFGRAADGFSYTEDNSALQNAFSRAVERARTSHERRVSALNRLNSAGRAFTALLNRDDDARHVASALVEADSGGLFATNWREQ